MFVVDQLVLPDNLESMIIKTMGKLSHEATKHTLMWLNFEGTNVGYVSQIGPKMQILYPLTLAYTCTIAAKNML